MRLIWLFVGLALLFLIPFLALGGRFEDWLSGEGAVEWLRSYGAWAWAAALALLLADLVLPVLGTAIMAALGLIYGPLLGGLIGTAGSVASGLLAYGLCRGLGRGAAERIAGAEALQRGESLFAEAGGWLVVLSRWLPLMPEVVACMAGLAKMRFGVFACALVCGSAPLAFVFAGIGAAGSARPGLAIGLSIVLPPLLWLAVRPAFVRRARSR